MRKLFEKHALILSILFLIAGVCVRQLTLSRHSSLLSTASAQSTNSCATNARGDANCDVFINDIDYNLWRSAYKNEPAPPVGIRDADFNNDGKVDLIDFEIWRQGRFGPTITSAPTEVPSPTPLVGSCQCDLGSVTENSCAAGAQPVCSGRFDCTCTTTNPTVGPTCVPLPACVNDPVNPCAVRPPFPGYYCTTTPTQAPPRPTSPVCSGGNTCPIGWTCNSSTMICEPNSTPIPTWTPPPPPLTLVQENPVPACSQCGYVEAKTPLDACKGVSCIGMSCQATAVTCTVNGVSNTSCYRTQCVGDDL